MQQQAGVINVCEKRFHLETWLFSCHLIAPGVNTNKRSGMDFNFPHGFLNHFIHLC